MCQNNRGVASFTAGPGRFVALGVSNGILAHVGISAVNAEVATETVTEAATKLAATQVDAGKQIFRFDTFGAERLWTDQRMHDVVGSAVDPIAFELHAHPEKLAGDSWAYQAIARAVHVLLS